MRKVLMMLVLSMFLIGTIGCGEQELAPEEDTVAAPAPDTNPPAPE